MSIKLRAELDNLLTVDDLHFDMTNNKKLCIKTKCGKELVIFYDLSFSKKDPTKDEINFVKKILTKEIDKINKKLKKLKDLEKNKVEEITYSSWNNEVYSKKYSSCSVICDDDFKPITYKIQFSDKNEVENIINDLDEQVKNIKKYLKWKEEYDKIISELNQNCNI